MQSLYNRLLRKNAFKRAGNRAGSKNLKLGAFSFLIQRISACKQTPNKNRLPNRKWQSEFPVDHALATACDFKLFSNTGAILENAVFIHLRKKTEDIHYYKTSNGYEIDFVTGTEGNIEPYQVCADLSDEDTKKRELRAISEACTELKCKQATVVTLYDEGTFSLKDCTVKIVRAVDWLLS